MTPVICVPVKELKNTSSFTETVQSSSGPVVVTKNGQGAFVSMSLECYEAMAAEAARAKLYQALDQAEDDIRSGRVYDAKSVIEDMRRAHDL